MTVIAATGHRPNKLDGYGIDQHKRLTKFAADTLAPRRPETVISGMALGWDQAVAVATLQLGIPLVCALPFDGQDRPWTVFERDRYAGILKRAADVVIVTQPAPSPENYNRVAKAMQDRNIWMVDHADEMLAMWDGTDGGTANCIRYARETDVPVNNVWKTWTLPDDVRALI